MGKPPVSLHDWRRHAALAIGAVALALTVGSCGGGGGGSATPAGAGSSLPCANGCEPPRAEFLSEDDVRRILAQAIFEAQARRAPAAIVVVDRVGNVLAAFEMTGAPRGIVTNGDRGVRSGLDDAVLDPPASASPDTSFAALAAISKALTSAYFSSRGNAFTTRTAGQILQEHFNVTEANVPAGPLFSVQFSQLVCSDIVTPAAPGTAGPRPAPLGFAADPGAVPLYKNGAVVGAIAVTSDRNYSVDRNLLDVETDNDELIAVAGSRGFEAPTAIRADRVTADGRTLRFTDSESLASDPARAPSYASLEATAGRLLNLPGFGGKPIVAGTAFGSPASGIRPDTSGAFGNTGAYILVDGNNVNRFPPRAGSDGLLTQAEVTQLLKSALEIANRSRSQIRRPSGLTAEVSAVVVDTNGEVVGYVRSPDALVDSVDVVIQKARTATFFSDPRAAEQLLARPPAIYGNGLPASSIAAYVEASRRFFNDPSIFANGIGFSTRSITSIASPFFPDGIENTPNGPLSRPYADWSIFSTGLQLDLSLNNFLGSLLSGDFSNKSCTGIPAMRSGMSLFGGGFPIFRGNKLVGAIGVSGDGTDQSDLIAFLALAQAGRVLNTGIGHPPPARRADQLEPKGPGTRLRYANCPTSPFLDSTEQNACAGL